MSSSSKSKSSGRSAGIAPPRAAKRPATQVHHGVTLRDDYGWLRDPRWQDVMRDPSLLQPEIRTHIEAENAYTDAMLADTKALQEVLFQEMKGRIKEDDSSVPAPDGPFDYYSSYVTGGQYPRLCRRPRGGTGETILLDGNREAEGKPFWQIGATAHSPDHKLLAYAVDDKGSELYVIRVRDLATGKDLADEIADTRGGIEWARDGRTFFYVRVDEMHRPLIVCRHKIGTPASADVVVHEEKDPGFFAGVSQTHSGRYIMVGAHGTETDDFRLIDAERPESAPIVVAGRKSGHEYHVEHSGERLYILTNFADAEDYCIVETSTATPTPEHWRTLVPHKPGRMIIEATAYRDHLVRLEREDGLPRIVIRRLKDGAEHAIAFEEEAYSLGISAGYEFDTTTLRFTYSSMTSPTAVYDYDMETRARTLRKVQEVPSGHDPSDYITRRVLAPSHDGELVPVSLLYRKSTPLDGSAPVFLYGYGAYGIAMPASFSTARLSLVDRGFIYALAHIRGGRDRGTRWYRDGKLAKKTNTFRDFIAAGEHLVNLGLTRRGRIVANGGSAGGMLMGAVANMAPDLFLGIIADVPFVDVLNTMLDDTLPLTPPEFPEWGNPITDRAAFEAIRAYSPYDNVAAKAYPHIFAYAGLTDPRVTYWEPAKWVARLRELKTDDNLLLLKTNMGAGHGGASGRFEQLVEIAVDYAFALKIAGLGKLS
ncbi:MAG TPA: S9 family peptidase [Hyphomicrobiaceae bacterium]|nr:S9 family peptidase [Hyphomicrobiaceae bacterium]